MHEASLARGILKAVLNKLPTPATDHIKAIHGHLSESEALSPQSLQIHFDAQSQGTPAQGAQLQLSLHHIQAHCQACDHTYLPEHHLTLCPNCGSTDGVLLGKAGLRITGIELG